MKLGSNEWRSISPIRYLTESTVWNYSLGVSTEVSGDLPKLPASAGMTQPTSRYYFKLRLT